MPDEYINTAELARRTGLAVNTWNKRRLLGGEQTPPFIRVGRAIRYHWPTVQGWLHAREQQGQSEGSS